MPRPAPRHQTHRPRRPLRHALLAAAATVATLGATTGAALAGALPGLVDPGASLAGAPPGLVDPVAAPLPTDAPTRTERYGVQILAADVALFATLAVAAKAEVDDSVGSLIALGYFATGPLIHLKHGNTRGAVRSMAARALLPMGGALVGMVLASNNRCDGDLCGLEVVGGMAIGGAVGMASAMVLDWTVLGKTEVEAPVVGRVVISPRVDVSRRGVSVGVGGAF